MDINLFLNLESTEEDIIEYGFSRIVSCPVLPRKGDNIVIDGHEHRAEHIYIDITDQKLEISLNDWIVYNGEIEDIKTELEQTGWILEY